MGHKKKNQLMDIKVNVKTKLALFWTALMFLYIYNDILSFLQPGHVAQLLEGQMEGVQFTQVMLFFAAVLMALPSIMILLSLVLKAKQNRIVNIVLSLFHILVLIGTQFVGDSKSWYYWRYNEVLEGVFLLIIFWTAWKWPRAEEKQPPNHSNHL